jgi:pimeloyl-ACP methyl ester carboxylesterase
MLTTLIRFGVSLNALRLANAKPRNLIIHHGLMGSSKNFRSLSRAQPISTHFNAYLIDARNHGESPHTPTHTISELADDLLEFIESNGLDNPSQPVTLMGHSMGGLALMEFTKRHASAKIQAYIDRVIIIDIPTDPVQDYPSYKLTGNMLKSLSSIDLTQPLKAIHAGIDQYAVSPNVAALMKTNLLKNEDESYRWVVNLRLLAYEGYDNIGRYNLADGHSKLWKKPMEYIYGEKSNYYDSKHH